MSESAEGARSAAPPLRAASYNIHQFCGHRWRLNVGRSVAALRALDVPILALQEVLSGRVFPRRGLVGPNPSSWLSTALGMQHIAHPTVSAEHGEYGNAILTRLPVLDSGLWDLALGWREPRNALYAVLATDAGPLRVVTTHFGLRSSERINQVYRLLDHINQDTELPTLLLGDFNEWSRHGLVTRAVEEHFATHAPLASYPAVLPIVPLDRIFWRPSGLVERVYRARGTLFRRASDHRPVIAELRPG
ncbi:endonuclease/exonuclease/phosphatase family protein [Haliangium ochraceum]|uniref:Endonuclease/exonuclease/phosphatase n=1 Tax=Haliangium ochraceum (strain DSM 14365 / JCM 11303 / SMP-2) TaxID=502025 RepID=D0LI50_HALO1|nr:endonuclease/exonuclease/phosphatase family protein [Haliangium ochraceum]ACY16429.1 Endonuclease/exonuclease/phosphatase [Haliangium ochraceum DSM 14365]